MKLTQEAFGARFHVTKGNVSAWENGRHSPSYQQIVTMAEISGLSLPDFVDRSPSRAEEQQAAYGPTISDEEAELIRDLRELLRDRWDHYASEIRKEADIARAYKAMAGRPLTPVDDEHVAKHLPPAPAVQPVERRTGSDRRTYAVRVRSDGTKDPQTDKNLRGKM